MGREYNNDPYGDKQSWGGFAGRPSDPNTPGDPGQGNGASQDVNRYRNLGVAAANRQAYQQNFDAANSDRNNAAYARLNQQDAVRLQQEAAYGQAPSAAQSLSRNMLDQSLQAQMAGAASARGGSLAQAAAMRGASQQAMGMQQQGMNQIGAMRAQEMAQARDAYTSASSQLRGQDYQSQALAQQQAGMQQQSELAQRQMNQQAQQNYEQMGWNTQNAQLNADVQRYGIDQGTRNQQRDRDFKHDEAWTDRLWKAGGSLLDSIGNFSDENAKVPIGSLGAPQGYAASRAGQGGYMFGSETAADGSQMAPGTQDYMHAMGGGPKLDGTGAKPGGGGSRLGMLLHSMGRGMSASDEETKVPTILGRQAPESPSSYATSGGGIDVMGTFRAQNAAIDEGRRHPYGGPAVGGAAGGMMSDERSKTPSGVMGYEENARIGPDGLGYVDRPEAESVVPGKFAAMQAAKEGRPGLATAAKAKRRPKVDLDKWADAELAKYRAENAKLDRGEYKSALAPVVEQSRMADAARAMASVPYAYKPGLQPPEQAPGEPNVGPIAQNMAQNPVTATAVKRDPATGLLMLDQGKMTKVLGGVVSNQQREIDSLKASLAAVAARGQ